MSDAKERKRELDRAAALALKAKESVWWFSRARWSHMTSDPFLVLRHQQMIAEFLEAFFRREIQHLLIACPPGVGKSELVSCDFPAWAFQKNPSIGIMCISYGEGLTKKFSRRCRDIMRTKWYQECFPHVQIRSDVDNIMIYQTTQGGWRKACTVGGDVTGEHPHYILIDDPLKLSDSGSAVKKRFVNTWSDSELFTRGWTKNAGILVNAQRFADDDLFAYLEDRPGFVKLVLPMEYDPRVIMENPLGIKDWRKKPGERLCPKEFVSDDALAVQRLKGAHYYSAQFQQRPTAETGELISREWFKIVRPTKIEKDLLKEKGKAVRFWDKASTATPRSDRTAGVLMVELDGTYWVVDIHVGRWDSYKRNEEIRTTSEIDAAQYCNYIVAMEMETSGGGAESAQTSIRELEGFRVRIRKPRGGKPKRDEYDLKRWEPWAIALGRGDVVFCECDNLEECISEHCDVPNGHHDDMVDACSGAYTELAIYGKRYALRRPLLLSKVGKKTQEKRQEKSDPLADILSASSQGSEDWVEKHW